MHSESEHLLKDLKLRIINQSGVLSFFCRDVKRKPLTCWRLCEEQVCFLFHDNTHGFYAVYVDCSNRIIVAATISEKIECKNGLVFVPIRLPREVCFANLSQDVVTLFLPRLIYPSFLHLGSFKIRGLSGGGKIEAEGKIRLAQGALDELKDLEEIDDKRQNLQEAETYLQKAEEELAKDGNEADLSLAKQIREMKRTIKKFRSELVSNPSSPSAVINVTEDEKSSKDSNAALQILKQLNKPRLSPLKKTTILSEGASSKIYNTDIPRVICKEPKIRQDNLKDTERELQFFKSGLRHPYIIQKLAVDSEDKNLIYLERGDELRYRLGEAALFQRLMWFKQVLQALCYLHNQGWTHNDIKIENILIVGNVAKLADFGSAKANSDTKEDIEGLAKVLLRFIIGADTHVDEDSIKMLDKTRQRMIFEWLPLCSAGKYQEQLLSLEKLTIQTKLENNSNNCWWNSTLKFLACTTKFDFHFQKGIRSLANDSPQKQFGKAFLEALESIRNNDFSSSDQHSLLSMFFQLGNEYYPKDQMLKGKQYDVNQCLERLFVLLNVNTTIESHDTCEECRHRFKEEGICQFSKEQRLILRLEPKKSQCSISLEDEYYSEDSSDDTGLWKRIKSITYAPGQLVLQVNRIQQGADKKSWFKNKAPLRLTRENLMEIQIFNLQENEFKLEYYRLLAAIVHLGENIDSGHYECHELKENGSVTIHSDTDVTMNSQRCDYLTDGTLLLLELTSLNKPNIYKPNTSSEPLPQIEDKNVQHFEPNTQTVSLKQIKNKNQESGDELHQNLYKCIWESSNGKVPEFIPVGKKTEGCTLGAWFEKKTDKKDSKNRRWLGKFGVPSGYDKEISLTSRNFQKHICLDSALEKIADELFGWLSNAYITPKTLLAYLPIENQFTTKNDLFPFVKEQFRRNDSSDGTKPLKTVFLMSKYILGYRDLCKLNVQTEKGVLSFMDFIDQTGSVPNLVLVDGESMPLKGLLELLVASRLLGDTDCLGGGGKNAGFIVKQCSDTKQKEAIVVKIDPGFSFNFDGEENKLMKSLSRSKKLLSFLSVSRLKDARDIQIGNNSGIIQWKSLSKEQQECYIKAILDMMGKLEGRHYYGALMDQQENFNKHQTILRTNVVKKIKKQLDTSCRVNKEVYSKEMKQYSCWNASELRLFLSELSEKSSPILQQYVHEPIFLSREKNFLEVKNLIESEINNQKRLENLVNFFKVKKEDLENDLEDPQGLDKMQIKILKQELTLFEDLIELAQKKLQDMKLTYRDESLTTSVSTTGRMKRLKKSLICNEIENAIEELQSITRVSKVMSVLSEVLREDIRHINSVLDLSGDSLIPTIERRLCGYLAVVSRLEYDTGINKEKKKDFAMKLFYGLERSFQIEDQSRDDWVEKLKDLLLKKELEKTYKACADVIIYLLNLLSKKKEIFLETSRTTENFAEIKNKIEKEMKNTLEEKIKAPESALINIIKPIWVSEIEKIYAVKQVDKADPNSSYIALLHLEKSDKDIIGKHYFCSIDGVNVSDSEELWKLLHSKGFLIKNSINHKVNFDAPGFNLGLTTKFMPLKESILKKLSQAQDTPFVTGLVLGTNRVLVNGTLLKTQFGEESNIIHHFLISKGVTDKPQVYKIVRLTEFRIKLQHYLLLKLDRDFTNKPVNLAINDSSPREKTGWIYGYWNTDNVNKKQTLFSKEIELQSNYVQIFNRQGFMSSAIFSKEGSIKGFCYGYGTVNHLPEYHFINEIMTSLREQSESDYLEILQSISVSTITPFKQEIIIPVIRDLNSRKIIALRNMINGILVLLLENLEKIIKKDSRKQLQSFIPKLKDLQKANHSNHIFSSLVVFILGKNIYENSHGIVLDSDQEFPKERFSCFKYCFDKLETIIEQLMDEYQKAQKNRKELSDIINHLIIISNLVEKEVMNSSPKYPLFLQKHCDDFSLSIKPHPNQDKNWNLFKEALNDIVFYGIWEKGELELLSSALFDRTYVREFEKTLKYYFKQKEEKMLGLKSEIIEIWVETLGVINIGDDIDALEPKTKIKARIRKNFDFFQINLDQILFYMRKEDPKQFPIELCFFSKVTLNELIVSIINLVNVLLVGPEESYCLKSQAIFDLIEGLVTGMFCFRLIQPKGFLEKLIYYGFDVLNTVFKKAAAWSLTHSLRTNFNGERYKELAKYLDKEGFRGFLIVSVLHTSIKKDPDENEDELFYALCKSISVLIGKGNLIEEVMNFIFSFFDTIKKVPYYQYELRPPDWVDKTYSEKLATYKAIRLDYKDSGIKFLNSKELPKKFNSLFSFSQNIEGETTTLDFNSATTTYLHDIPEPERKIKLEILKKLLQYYGFDLNHCTTNPHYPFKHPNIHDYTFGYNRFRKQSPYGLENEIRKSLCEYIILPTSRLCAPEEYLTPIDRERLKSVTAKYLDNLSQPEKQEKLESFEKLLKSYGFMMHKTRSDPKFPFLHPEAIQGLRFGYQNIAKQSPQDLEKEIRADLSQCILLPLRTVYNPDSEELLGMKLEIIAAEFLKDISQKEKEAKLDALEKLVKHYELTLDDDNIGTKSPFGHPKTSGKYYRFNNISKSPGELESEIRQALSQHMQLPYKMLYASSINENPPDKDKLIEDLIARLLQSEENSPGNQDQEKRKDLEQLLDKLLDNLENEKNLSMVHQDS